MTSVLLVFLGGGLGSVCRYGVSQIWMTSKLPYGTLTANILSSLLLGLLIGLSAAEILKSQQRLLLMTGFCGGFSTFSTFSGELIELYQSGETNLTVLYLILSILSGVVSIIIGIYLSRIIMH